MQGKEVLVSLKEVHKVYYSRHGKVLAIQNVSFDIKEGEFVVVVGPSGCGKSTLLRIIAGLLPYDGGQISFDGVPLTGPVRDIGLVFQRAALFPWKTVLGNVLAPIDLMGLSKKKYLGRAKELITLTRLDRFENHYPNELSGGMQQRVAICRALIHDPKFILMDEPFGALDAMTRDKMNLEILRIWREERKTILFVTHSVYEAVFLADKIIALSDRPSVVREIIPVELTRPRTIELRGTSEYAHYAAHLYGLLQTEFQEKPINSVSPVDNIGV